MTTTRAAKSDRQDVKLCQTKALKALNHLIGHGVMTVGVACGRDGNLVVRVGVNRADEQVVRPQLPTMIADMPVRVRILDSISFRG